MRLLSYALLFLFFASPKTEKNTPEHPDTVKTNSIKKTYYAYAVTWSTSEEKAYISPISKCEFKDGEKTSDAGLQYKNFADQWRSKVESRYNTKGFYNLEFSGWYESAGKADTDRDAKISFYKNQLKYEVRAEYSFGFYPTCE